MDSCPGLNMEHGFLAKIQRVVTKERQYQFDEDEKKAERRMNKICARNADRRNRRPPRQLYSIPARRRGAASDDLEDEATSLDNFLQKCSVTQDLLRHKDEVARKCLQDVKDEGDRKMEEMIEQCSSSLMITENDSNGNQEKVIPLNMRMCGPPGVEDVRQTSPVLTCTTTTTITGTATTDNMDFERLKDDHKEETSPVNPTCIPEISSTVQNNPNTESMWTTPGDSCLMTDTIKDPSFVSEHSLKRVAMALVSTSCQSEISSFTARRICMAIIQKEKEMTIDDPQHRFIQAILEACRLHAKPYMEQPIPGIIPLINFVGLMYRSEDMHKSVGEDMAEVLQDLLCVELHHLRHLHEAQHLYSILHKTATRLERDIPDKMAALTNSVRNVFLTLTAMDAVKDVLLDIIEAMAGRWSGRTTHMSFTHDTWTEQ